MKKKAISIMIVLGFITIIIGILASVYKIYDKYLDANFAKTISEDVILNRDIKVILGNLLDKIQDDKNIKTLCQDYTNIVINDEFRLSVDIKPLFDRININDYNVNEGIRVFMNNVLEYYRIFNIQLFEDILVDSIDKDTKEREYGSEIKLYNPYFQDGEIYNYKDFKMIIDYYFNLTKDKNIYKVPWQKLFYFHKTSYNFVDCNLLNRDFLNILGVFANAQCQTILANVDEKMIKSLKIMAFDKNNPFYLDIKINYFFNSFKSTIRLIYDIKTQKVISFEKYPIY